MRKSKLDELESQNTLFSCTKAYLVSKKENKMEYKKVLDAEIKYKMAYR
jgi:hypothetical protein